MTGIHSRFPSIAKSPAALLAAALVSAAVLLPMLWQGSAYSAETAVTIPAPSIDEPASAATSETAVLAGGCFWGVQGVFQHVKGVSQAVSGYTGGAKSTAQYEEVGSGLTGHAESVQVSFDPHQISYGKILQIYFSVAHNPTELNRQGPDSGSQYRSAIFPMSEAQRKVAADYIAELDKAHVYTRPIVTTIEPNKTFYPAESYHQNFLALNPTYGYIVANDLPKIADLKRVFPDQYRPEPALVPSNATAAAH